jgi:ParB family chromosome partitioning protein
MSEKLFGSATYASQSGLGSKIAPVPQASSPPVLVPSVTESITLISPDCIREASLPNRDSTSFESDGYYELQKSIRLSGGNLQPIKVRTIPASGGATSGSDIVKYEVVFGHRRLHACRMLEIQVRAVVVDDLTDEQLLIERIGENTGREDFRPVELGRIFKFAIQTGLYSNQKHLASETDRDEGDISRAIQLADLPDEVISAFDAIGDLQYRHAKPLTDAVKRDRAKLVSTAIRIREEGGKRRPADVFSRLTHIEKPGIGRSNPVKKMRLELAGKAYGVMQSAGNGRVTIELRQAFDSATREELQLHLDSFMQRVLDRQAKVTPGSKNGGTP